VRPTVPHYMEHGLTANGGTDIKEQNIDLGRPSPTERMTSRRSR
jgi:hypothetical protein